MIQLQLFNAEGVRRRKRKTWRGVRTNKYAKEIAQQRDRARIHEIMHGPKLLSNAMPRVMPDVDVLRELGITISEGSWTKFVLREKKPIEATFRLTQNEQLYKKHIMTKNGPDPKNKGSVGAHQGVYQAREKIALRSAVNHAIRDKDASPFKK